MTRRRTARRVTTLVCRLAAALAAAGAARADESGDCTGFAELKAADLAIAHLGGVTRTFFVKGASEAQVCPNTTPACQAKAFLVPGDTVVAGRTREGFTCVDYFGKKGADRAGWLPSESLVREEPTPVMRDDWVGTWLQAEAKVSIKPGPAGTLSIHGEATFGALDPDRVRRGAVNVGALDGKVAPDGPKLAFDMGTDTTLPVDKGDDTDCKVWMRRLGTYLLVEDNGMCGGMNVSFGGAYHRQR